jgi:hypothetical protein
MDGVKKLFLIPWELHREILKKAAVHTGGNYTKMVILILSQHISKYE